MTLMLPLMLSLTVVAQMPPAPTPGPEHKLLAQDAGRWNAVVEMVTEPGKPAATSKGVEVNTVGCSGLCLITDFKSEMMGAPFHGHGMTTWDAKKKVFIGTWMDSMSTTIAIGESTYDPKTKRFTGTMDMPDMTGQIVKTRSVVEMPAPDRRVMTMYAPGPDGKEMQVMKITYTRAKM